ncbi:hypothetical protein WICPIJ_002731 [Wickerhamomyces pijperi]|uniref:Uncharacterized protein n=1 Tax=Wickerhamomyces pijperi TaxID=599730 RepID=A0A9P8Q8F3_WICPI|nr:hypothetical protein WICPIJ_002731 [Wickerhamomyces pijperi]
MVLSMIWVSFGCGSRIIAVGACFKGPIDSSSAELVGVCGSSSSASVESRVSPSPSSSSFSSIISSRTSSSSSSSSESSEYSELNPLTPRRNSSSPISPPLINWFQMFVINSNVESLERKLEKVYFACRV